MRFIITNVQLITIFIKYFKYLQKIIIDEIFKQLRGDNFEKLIFTNVTK
jgi:hypothetical protein